MTKPVEAFCGAVYSYPSQAPNPLSNGFYGALTGF